MPASPFWADALAASMNNVPATNRSLDMSPPAEAEGDMCIIGTSGAAIGYAGLLAFRAFAFDGPRAGGESRDGRSGATNGSSGFAAERADARLMSATPD